MELSLILEDEYERNLKKLNINRKNMKHYINATTDNFIFTHTLTFISRFEINRSFFKNSDLWKIENNYNAAAWVVKNLQVINDLAEQTVKLTKEYIDCITKIEKEKQDILRIIIEYK